LSKKLHLDQRNSGLQQQASDTSFATTKSGATIATSHSTSTTGISSRKTLELIRRFERYNLIQQSTAASLKKV
jgi:hypothetical protein